MNYYANIRVRVLTNDSLLALSMVNELVDEINMSDLAEDATVCTVTEQDGLEVKDLVNNID